MTRPFEPRFPPLYSGVALPPAIDPFAEALARADTADPGTLLWSRDAAALRAAVLLAPEQPLGEAIGVVLAAALGLADAIGALAPPEVAVEFVWPDRLKVNGAACGGWRAAASTSDPRVEPDWLAVGVGVPVLPLGDVEPGHDPDATTLFGEGCTDITPPLLVEAWSRHMLVWINRFLGDGPAPLCTAFHARTVGATLAGLVEGLEGPGGLLLKGGDTVRRVPLTVILDPQWPTLPEPSASTTAISTSSTCPPRSASGRSPARSSSPTGPTRN